MSDEKSENDTRTRHMGMRIRELEEENSDLRMKVTFLRTQATNAMTDLEDGDVDEAIETLKQVAY